MHAFVMWIGGKVIAELALKAQAHASCPQVRQQAIVIAGSVANALTATVKGDSRNHS